jgi:hypothetical protein
MLETKYNNFLDTVSPTNITSQFGEDGIIAAIFSKIGIVNSWCLEVGAADGIFASNTHSLINKGWNSIQIECDKALFGRLENTYKNNDKVFISNKKVGLDLGNRLDDILTEFNAPIDIDLVVIDVDGQDYFIANSLIKYKPRVLVVEYNSDSDTKFIPNVNGDGQAGKQAITTLLHNKGYSVVCGTRVNLIAVRNDISYLLENSDKEEVNSKEEIKPSHNYVMMEITDESTGNSEKLRVSGLTSVPRLGFTDHHRMAQMSFNQFQIPLAFTGGAFWEQGIQNGLIDALENDVDLIITLDYDSVFFPEDLKNLLLLAVKFPEADAIVPLQLKRGNKNDALFSMNEVDGYPVTYLHPTLSSTNLTPILIGHFGLTLIRTRALKDIPKPWLLNVPNESGEWRNGQTNADIYFWKKFREFNKKAFLANRIRIGHIDEYVISLDENMQVKRYNLRDYMFNKFERNLV